MRIFLAGASGVLGVRLVPLLAAAGHTVAGLTRSPDKADRLRELGAEPVVADVFDAAALTRAVVAFAQRVIAQSISGSFPPTAAAARPPSTSGWSSRPAVS